MQKRALAGRNTHYNGVESGLYRCSRHTRTAIEYLSESRTFFGRNIFRSGQPEGKKVSSAPIAAPYCTASACAITLVLRIVGRTWMRSPSFDRFLRGKQFGDVGRQNVTR